MCVNVTLVADGVVENDVEDLLLVLSTEEERVTIGRGVATLSIMDMDSECVPTPFTNGKSHNLYL